MKVGRGTGPHPPNGVPAAEAPGHRSGDPIAPTEFPRGRSAAGTGRARKPPLRCNMRPPRGGYQPPDHVRGTDIGFGLPPNAFRTDVAIGQPVHRLRRCPPTESTG